MKKLLILAYDFPPYISVGGLRPFNWYKYLKNYDIYPIVVTRQWNNKFGNSIDYIAPSELPKTIIEKTERGEIIRAPYFPTFANKLMIKYGDSKYKLIRKLVSAYFEFFQWIFLIGPKIQIYNSANEYLKTNKVDAIIATGDPFILFRYANLLSKKYKTPWIADYRDIWSNDFPFVNKPILRSWSQFFEKRIVKNSLLITTVSNFVVEKTKSVVKNKQFHIIANGFDPEVIEKTLEFKQNDKELNIGFVGSIFKWHPYESFLSAVSDLLSINNEFKLKVNFYGINISEELIEIINKKYPNLLQTVFFYPKMPNEEVLVELAKNNIVLLFNYYSYMGTKIYDYIGIKRQILLCYKNDSEANELRKKHYTIKDVETESNQLQADLISKTKSGIIVDDKTHLKEVLFNLYNEFVEKGTIECNSINTEQFSRKIQSKKLAELIQYIQIKQ